MTSRLGFAGLFHGTHGPIDKEKDGYSTFQFERPSGQDTTIKFHTARCCEHTRLVQVERRLVSLDGERLSEAMCEQTMWTSPLHDVDDDDMKGKVSEQTDDDAQE